MAIAHIEPQPTDKSPPGSDEPMRMYPISGGHFDSERHARCSRPLRSPVAITDRRDRTAGPTIGSTGTEQARRDATSMLASHPALARRTGRHSPTSLQE